MIGEASDGPPPGGGRVATGVPRLRWLIAMILAAAGFAVVASRPSPPETRPPTGDVAKIQQAILDQLDPTSGRDPVDDLPADFVAQSGRAPIHLRAPDGTLRAVHPGGGCSSPWGDTRWDYSVGCKAHDLGYDMLRYAARKGQPLAPDLRERLDDRLSMDMHAQCRLNPRGSPAFCEVVASLYTVGLVVNSWHQRWGPPQSEPVGPWSVAMIVIMLLIAVRAPAVVRRGVRHRPHRRVTRPRLDATAGAQAAYLNFLRIVSLTGIVLAESVLAFTMRGSAEDAWLWPLTWLLQLVPLFFLAGGHANLLAWRAALDGGAGYGTYLVGRIGWLIRPVLAFVIAWLVIPLSLELLDAPEEAITAFSRLIVQPLWLLGLYLLVVAATPAMYRLHRRLPVTTPLALLAGVVALGLVRGEPGGTVAGHVGGVLVALLFGQLAFHYADRTLWRFPRWALVAVAVAAFGALVVLTTLGGESKLQLAVPTGYAAFVPSLAGVLLIGLAQTCLVALPRERGLLAVATSPPARAMAFVRAAPMTVYLGYLCAMLVVEGLVGVARSAGVFPGGIDWLLHPRTVLALAMLALPTLVTFLLFERRGTARPEPDLVDVADEAPRTWVDTAAAGLGVAYGALGVLGFAVTGLSGWTQTSTLLGLPIDPMASLIHLLLGWYLVHCVHLQTSSRPGPWLVTAIACVPPMITTMSGAGTVVHGATMAGALAVAVVCAVQSRTGADTRPVPATSGASN
jgi:hypothetical protein